MPLDAFCLLWLASQVLDHMLGGGIGSDFDISLPHTPNRGFSSLANSEVVTSFHLSKNYDC